jgi:hypothetical protein
MIPLAATVTTNKRTKMLGMYVIVADVQLDASYPTGGYALAPATFGLTTYDFVLPAACKGYDIEFNHATNKLMAYNNAVEVTAATSLATLKVRLLAMGT